MTPTEKLSAAIANAQKHDPAGENPSEMMGRVASMILDKGGTWDLSENDQRALAFVYGKALAPAPETEAKTDADFDLRRLLAMRHGCSIWALYLDDGELQCKSCGIDFKRDRPERISTRFYELGLAQLTSPPPRESSAGEMKPCCPDAGDSPDCHGQTEQCRCVVCAYLYWLGSVGSRDMPFRRARVEERERCAALVESWQVDRQAFVLAGPRAFVAEPKRIAAAIRSLPTAEGA